MPIVFIVKLQSRRKWNSSTDLHFNWTSMREKGFQLNRMKIKLLITTLIQLCRIRAAVSRDPLICFFLCSELLAEISISKFRLRCRNFHRRFTCTWLLIVKRTQRCSFYPKSKANQKRKHKKTWIRSVVEWTWSQHRHQRSINNGGLSWENLHRLKKTLTQARSDFSFKLIPHSANVADRGCNMMFATRRFYFCNLWRSSWVIIAAPLQPPSERIYLN